MDRPFLAHARDLNSRGGTAGLDVFGAVSKALGDLDLKTIRASAAHLAVHAIASATFELDPQGSYVRTIDKGLAQRITVDGPRSHIECLSARPPERTRARQPRPMPRAGR